MKKRSILCAALVAAVSVATVTEALAADTNSEAINAFVKSSTENRIISAVNTAVSKSATAAEAVQESGIYYDGEPVYNAAEQFFSGILYCSVKNVVLAALPDAVITAANGRFQITSDELSADFTVGSTYVQANGRYLYVPGGVKNVGGVTLLPARTLAKILGCTATWNPSTEIMSLRSTGEVIESGDSYYDQEDLYWLSRIIYGESGNQPLTGKIAVGNVILNRVESSLFPNTIYDVIFQKNQFTPAGSSYFDRTPNAESVIAAKLVLDGAVVLDDALYFNQAGLNCWAARNCSYVTTIGGHAFYA